MDDILVRKNTKAIIALIKRTRGNINFYIQHEQNCHILNEIGVLRGLIYAYEEIAKKEYQLDEWELKIIKLQEELRNIDNKNT